MEGFGWGWGGGNLQGGGVGCCVVGWDEKTMRCALLVSPRCCSV